MRSGGTWGCRAEARVVLVLCVALDACEPTFLLQCHSVCYIVRCARCPRWCRWSWGSVWPGPSGSGVEGGSSSGGGSDSGPHFGGAAVDQEGSDIGLPSGTFFATGGPVMGRGGTAAGTRIALVLVVACAVGVRVAHMCYVGGFVAWCACGAHVVRASSGVTRVWSACGVGVCDRVCACGVHVVWTSVWACKLRLSQAIHCFCLAAVAGGPRSGAHVPIPAGDTQYNWDSDAAAFNRRWVVGLLLGLLL